MSRARIAVYAGISALLGCAGDTDPPWQLDHDRIIAVRATPPRIAMGEQAVVDALIGTKGPVSERPPDDATVVSPASLGAALRWDSARWVVTAPSGEALAAVRDELGLAADALIPLQVRVQVAYPEGSLVATKTVWLGGAATNPTMPDIEIDHARAAATEVVIAPRQDIPLSIRIDDTHYDVTWLSSCGTMHDFDLPNAYLQVEDGDPASGELAVVVRDSFGGVSWQVWPIRAD